MGMSGDPVQSTGDHHGDNAERHVQHPLLFVDPVENQHDSRIDLDHMPNRNNIVANVLVSHASVRRVQIHAGDKAIIRRAGSHGRGNCHEMSDMSKSVRHCRRRLP